MRRRVVAVAVVAGCAVTGLLGRDVATARPKVGVACGPSGFTRATVPALGPGTGELHGVDAIALTTAWAVGGRFDPTSERTVPYALRWDGVTWAATSVPAPVTSQGTVLLAVSGWAPDDAWAVGTTTLPNNLSRTFATHWDGSGWTTFPTPNAGTPKTGVLNGVVALAADDAWAVGSTSGQGGPERTVILHWDGSVWAVVSSPNRGPWPNGLSDVTAVSATDVWAVGAWRTKAFASRTLTVHWNGSGWHRVASPNPGTNGPRDVDLSGVSATVGGDVWAVGERGLRGLAERWDGSSWSVVTVPNPSANAGLSDVLAVTNTDAWAAGSWLDVAHQRVATQVQRWNGSSWSLVPTQHVGTSDNGIAAIDGVATRQWAVGYRFNASGLRILPLMLERCA